MSSVAQRASHCRLPLSIHLLTISQWGIYICTFDGNTSLSILDFFLKDGANCEDGNLFNYFSESKHLKGQLDPPVGDGNVFCTKGGQLDPIFCSRIVKM